MSKIIYNQELHWYNLLKVLYIFTEWHVILVFINARVDTSGRTVDGMPLDTLERFDFDQHVGFETKEDFEKKGFKLVDDNEE